ncbi:MAG: acetyl-CoA carboxylase, biotin carboxyl carrier protein [Candidatus Omnitrophica bacterium CG_4_9_14_0_2_um_filter_42_8]|nr:MAG: acetyl-CoA carboxylase, biotin carboxyl carrier protein [Candidatus Omnitrophica bacterium CG22_combo_CG10-13_8_21_14_all_43_16]PJC48583.1 MAG: acetyl-CoA carboxylase, biotin carboxyl carrier protein [Candidatus Omnitrophica bacterium CG_4_9_14_0_2_um_filter_42_8]
MNLKEIKELITLMNENELMELEIERDGMKIRLRKSASGKIETIAEERIAPSVAQIVKAGEKPAEPGKPERNVIAIKAPMVGTFYRSANPETKPYVEIGQTVEVGQVVCIIEAMKLMNEIKSEVRGKVTEILVENARSIEYGQALFMLEPM